MKYFGTDGIRGSYSEFLNFDLVTKVGKGLAQVLSDQYKAEKKIVLIGTDTRISKDTIKSILCANLTAYGIHVVDLGIITTPAVSYLTEINKEICAGIMISASHNPYYDNGIKIFNEKGKKLINESEEEIENVISEPDKFHLELADSDNIGTVQNNVEKYINQYITHLVNSVNLKSQINVAIDCAYGSTSKWAEKIFKNAGINVTTINTKFNGKNINSNAGSMHPKVMSEYINKGDFDLGFSFDGDGDRCIAFDSKGKILDGDVQLFLLAKKLKNESELKNDTIVTTIMSSIGFDKSLNNIGISVARTNVGDKYVADEMFKNNYYLGGEQSGHIIYRKYANTGDGMLSALQLISYLSDKNIDNEIAGLEIYPQRLINVKVKDKFKAMEDKRWLEKIASIEKEMNGNGRILIRSSGTENLIRVLVESSKQVVADEICENLVKYLKFLEL